MSNGTQLRRVPTHQHIKFNEAVIFSFYRFVARNGTADGACYRFTSALLPGGDICSAGNLLDRLVGAAEQREPHGVAKRPGCLIDEIAAPVCQMLRSGEAELFGRH